MNQIKLKLPAQTSSVDKLWDLYYNKTLVAGGNGKKYPILAAIKKKLLLSGNYQNHLFVTKFHQK